MTFQPMDFFRRDAANHDVRPVTIWLLRALYALMFVMLGMTAWGHIFRHQGVWGADEAMAWAVWAAFAVCAGIGLVRPLLMLPILLLEMVYKGIWLVLVAYPLWQVGQLWGSDLEYQTMNFIPGVVIPLAIIPWGYVWRRIARRDDGAVRVAA